MRVVNLAVYKFVNLGTLPQLRERLSEDTKRLGLRGTILLAPEGLNCFVAGSASAIAEIRTILAEVVNAAGGDPSTLPFKESFSDEQPFKRMLVKIKPEIITMGTPEIRPVSFTGKRVTPAELKCWLDEKRDLVILDTRNEYEYRIGTFEGALTMDLKTFRQFPEQARALPAELRKKTVVSFCTGGIRCEKASALLLNEGFEDVYQLDGGILKYFEDVGGAHYRGECFVFDERVSLDPQLRETETVLCYNCQNPVTVEEQRSPQYVPTESHGAQATREAPPQASCPHCFGRPKKHKELIAKEIKERAGQR
jgi:predicted sulfurtransferase